MTGASFASDNHAGVHPEVMAAIIAANEGFVPAYGDDPITAAATDHLRAEFGSEIGVFPVFNGTGANVVALQGLLRPYEAVVCTSIAHINVDECGAPERFIGTKLLDVEPVDGKLTIEGIESMVWGIGDPHHVQAKAISITQSTELGTVYSLDEIRAISSWAHERNMFVHLDGARIANAAAALGVRPGAFGAEVGVDMISFGATKNGAMGVEAIVVLKPELIEAMHFFRKQSMQLASKMRFMSAQIVALMTDDLWLRNAAHANAMSRRLVDAVGDLVEINNNVQVNAIFAMVDRDVSARLSSEFPFYIWNEFTGQVRWMTSWQTTEADVDAFAARLRELVAGS